MKDREAGGDLVEVGKIKEGEKLKSSHGRDSWQLLHLQEPNS